MARYAVTGSATGIGARIKERLSATGHELIGIDLRDAEIVADLACQSGRQQAIETILEMAPDGLDGLVTSAGVGSHVQDHGLIAAVNYFGSIELVEGLTGALALRRGAAIMISSNSAPMAHQEHYVEMLLQGDEHGARSLAAEIDGHQAYSGSKLAVARWMRKQAAALARQGVRINAIAPGYTETPMTQAVAEDPNYGESIRQFVASIPIGRPGTPDDIANLAEFLLSDKATYIVGSVLFVDGGHDAMLRPLGL